MATLTAQELARPKGIDWGAVRAKLGRHILAIGPNEVTARLCGISLRNTKLWIWVVALAFAGIAGMMRLAYLTVGDPTTANGMELLIIAAVVIGGASLSGGKGSVFGSLIMTVAVNGCTKMDFAQLGAGNRHGRHHHCDRRPGPSAAWGHRHHLAGPALRPAASSPHSRQLKTCRWPGLNVV
jgi:Branched-chain amino acid transport system / permease component